MAVYIGTQILPGGGEQPGLLVPGQQIFEFIPLKDGFIFTARSSLCWNGKVSVKSKP